MWYMVYYNNCKEVIPKGDLKMYEIIYNKEVIDTAKNTYYACDLVREYRVAFKSNNVYYRRCEDK